MHKMIEQTHDTEPERHGCLVPVSRSDQADADETKEEPDCTASTGQTPGPWQRMCLFVSRITGKVTRND